MRLRFETMFTRHAITSVVMTAALATTPVVLAQEQPATVHGHVQNPAGQAITKGQIKFTKDIHAEYKDEKFTNTVDLDAEGNYVAKDVAPGEYFAYVVVDGKTPDRQQFTVKSGDNATVNFDMTRADYIAKLSPEERKALEEYKAKNAEAVAGNKTIANLNATLTAVRADIKTPTPNFDKDNADMKQAITQRPNEGLLYAVQGDVLLAQGKKQAATDRANHTQPMQDDQVKQAYSNSVDSYKKAVDLMTASGSKAPVTQQAAVYNELGNAYGESGNAAEASNAYAKAASLDPKGAAEYYTNEAIVLDHNGGGDAEAAAADKAIAADPSKPLPYYLKGQALLAKATVDAKGQIVPPPGCLDAYQKYLELAPDGPQAPAVRDVLTQMGQKIETRYRAHGKR